MIGEKTDGRKKGTLNKITTELRKTLKGIIAAELETLPTTLHELPAKERLDLVIKLMPFCLPKMDSINGKYDVGWNADDE